MMGELGSDQASMWDGGVCGQGGEIKLRSKVSDELTSNKSGRRD